MRQTPFICHICGAKVYRDHVHYNKDGSVLYQYKHGTNDHDVNITVTKKKLRNPQNPIVPEMSFPEIPMIMPSIPNDSAEFIRNMMRNPMDQNSNEDDQYDDHEETED